MRCTGHVFFNFLFNVWLVYVNSTVMYTLVHLKWHGHQIEFKYFDKNGYFWIGTSTGFWTFKISLCWGALISIFQAVKVKTYGRNKKYWKCLQNHSLIISNTILKWSRLHSNRFLWTSKPYLRAADKFYCFSAAFSRYLSKKCYFSNMFSPNPRGKWQWRQLIRNILKIRKPWEILIYCSFKTVNFCPNIQRDPVPLNPPMQNKVYISRHNTISLILKI